MLYILTGQEQLLMDQKVAALKKEYPIFEPDLNDTKIDCRDLTCQEIINEVTSVPFFSDYRFVTLTHPYFLTTEKVKNSLEDEIERLVDALCHTSEDMIIIIYAPGKLDERKKWTKALRKVAVSLEFNLPDSKRLKQICRQAFKCLYSSHISMEEVKKLVSKPVEENAFELTSAILKRDLARVLSIYRDLMTKNEEPIRLIALMASSLRTLYQVKLLDRKGYNDQEIGKYLDMNPYRLRYIRNDTQNFELDDLLKLIQSLSELDVQIKSGMIDKYQGLELFFMKLI